MRSSKAAFMAWWVVTPMALAQPQGMGQWLYEVTTDNGDAIVDPGEVATVTLWMDLTPSVGETLPDGNIVAAYGGGFVNIIGGQDADQGMIIEWTVNDHLDDGVDGTTDGVSIFDQEVFQFPVLDIDPSDPIYLMSFQWRPLVHGEYEAMYMPSIDQPELMIDGFVIYTESGPAEIWPANEITIPIQVVPAPSSVLVLSALVAIARMKT